MFIPREHIKSIQLRECIYVNKNKIFIVTFSFGKKENHSYYLLSLFFWGSVLIFFWYIISFGVFPFGEYMHV